MKVICKSDLIIICLLVGLATSIELFYFFQKKKCNSFSKGELVECKVGGRGNVGDLIVDYRFMVEDKSYSSTAVYETDDVSPKVFKSELIGKYFPVIYDSNNIDNAHILIFPNDFEKYGLKFPDSLKWVVAFLK